MPPPRSSAPSSASSAPSRSKARRRARHAAISQLASYRGVARGALAAGALLAALGRFHARHALLAAASLLRRGAGLCHHHRRDLVAWKLAEPGATRLPIRSDALSQLGRHAGRLASGLGPPAAGAAPDRSALDPRHGGDGRLLRLSPLARPAARRLHHRLLPDRRSADPARLDGLFRSALLPA